MCSVYALIILLIIKNSAAGVIHLEDLKLNVNGAPSAPQNSNTSVSTAESVVNDETTNPEAKVSEDNNEHISDITDSPIVLSKAGKKVTANVKVNKTQVDSSKQEKLKKDDKTKPKFKITILKDPVSTTPSANDDISSAAAVKDIAENIIETRRMSGVNMYVPVSEDIFPKYDEDTFGKGIVRSGLSLIDLKGNILRIRL